MPKIDELLQEHSLHSVRSDGSQMIVLETGKSATDSEWEVLYVNKDGIVRNDGTLILPGGEKAVLRKVCDNEQLQKLAAVDDFVEWQSGVPEEQPNESVLTLRDRLERKEHELQEIKKQYDETTEQLQETRKKSQEQTKSNASQRKKDHMAARVDIDEIKSIAASIAERTPSETQKIIANQVELGAGFYQEVGMQSRASFQLSVWLAAAGGGIFLLTVVATVLVTFFRGNSALISIVGSIAAALTEGLAASNRLYNQASQQFANFQVDLDRINRSSISYAMISEDAFEKKTSKQQDAIVQITEVLQSSKT
jgi:hypothetical protein